MVLSLHTRITRHCTFWVSEVTRLEKLYVALPEKEASERGDYEEDDDDDNDDDDDDDGDDDRDDSASQVCLKVHNHNIIATSHVHNVVLG